MAVATGQTPTQSNGGSDDGVSYANAVNDEVVGLWTYATRWLINVGGTANAITATSDTAIVNPITALKKGMSFRFVATATNAAGGTTISIDSVGVKNLLSKAGATLGANTVVNGTMYLITYDGAAFRMNS